MPERPKSSEVVPVTPEMQAAWCAYEPPFELVEGMRLHRISMMIRDAFFAGMIAQRDLPTYPTVEELEGQGRAAHASGLTPPATPGEKE